VVDAHDYDHIVIGMMSDGIYVAYDGGFYLGWAEDV
jgi:hypothetical protein